MQKEKGRFSLLMDGLTKEWLWYDYETKKFSEYYKTEAEAKQAAEDDRKDAKVQFTEEECK
jgi:hypothetical protein